jgi:hypothetical protein
LPIERLEEAADGGFTGGFIEACSFVSSPSQSFERLLGAGFSPLGYAVEALGSADDGTDGNGEDGQCVVANTPWHTTVGDGEQGFVEEVGISFRELHGGEPRFEWGLEAWVGEVPGSVLSKGSDKA